MKKQLTFLLLGTLAFTACKKETQKQSVNEPTPKTDSHKTVNTVQPDYVELILIARAPGETFDTYVAQWNDCGIKVRGPLVYNFVKYPTLVNGVPVSSLSLTNTDATSSVEYQNTGPDGSVFAVSQVYMGTTDFAAFRSDMNAFHSAMDIYNQSGFAGAAPILGNYIQDSYTTASSSKTYIGKLIRITTGSHLAIAKVAYPLPTAATPTIQPLGDAIVTDPSDNKTYLLHGSNGVVTSCNPIVNGVTSSTSLSVSASYTANTPSSQDFHIWGSLIRANQTTYNFDFNQNTN